MSVYGAQSIDAPKYDDNARRYDAILVMSFGGPEGPDDVIPFLENVAGRRNIPRERLEEVAEHYQHFGGVSPINAQNRALIDALRDELKENGIDLPVYFGNRNWHPLIEDTLRQMRDDGVHRVLAFFTSAFSSYSGCRQYREDIIGARKAVGEDAPEVDRIRMFYNHPGFIDPMVESLRNGLSQWPEDERDNVHIVFTAHSIPNGMADNSNYVAQLEEACALVAERARVGDYRLVYQSRSGPPQVPWLEPDILDYMETVYEGGVRDILLVPIGFISDHMEVMFDLDTEAVDLAAEKGMKLVRAATVGTHPDFVSMIRELIVERMTENPTRRFYGTRGPVHDICPVGCCLPGERPAHGRPQPQADV